MQKFMAEATADVAGKKMTIRLDMNALAEFEDAHPGLKALDVISEMDEGSVSISLLRSLVHCSLLYHHPDASKRDAGDLISENPEILQKLLSKIAPDAGDLPEIDGAAEAGAEK